MKKPAEGFIFERRVRLSTGKVGTNRLCVARGGVEHAIRISKQTWGERLLSYTVKQEGGKAWQK